MQSESLQLSYIRKGWRFQGTPMALERVDIHRDRGRKRRPRKDWEMVARMSRGGGTFVCTMGANASSVALMERSGRIYSCQGGMGVGHRRGGRKRSWMRVSTLEKNDFYIFVEDQPPIFVEVYQPKESGPPGKGGRQREEKRRSFNSRGLSGPNYRGPIFPK